MAKEYKAPRTINRIAMWVNRAGVGPSSNLITKGRKSGQARRVPVTPIDLDGEEYIVAPYGEVGWVHNVRADPVATLRKGRKVRDVRLLEVTMDSPHVVKAYWDGQSFPRRFMDVPGKATVDDFASVAGRFPIFKVENLD